MPLRPWKSESAGWSKTRPGYLTHSTSPALPWWQEWEVDEAEDFFLAGDFVSRAWAAEAAAVWGPFPAAPLASLAMRILLDEGPVRQTT